MKVYLKGIVKELKNYSSTLDKTSILIDKPWALIDEEFEMQKLIFKKNKELILSKNGQVQIGKWDYFAEAKSLLIDRNSDKILCNEAFIDSGIMILRLDGTDNRFFILANENIVPDLDAIKYLNELRYEKLNIVDKKLFDGRTLEVQKIDTGYTYAMVSIGNFVTVDAEQIEDGKYQLADNNQLYEIKKGRIFKILTKKQYTNPSGEAIIIQQQNIYNIRNGDYVYMYGKQMVNEVINFTRSKNLIVRGGIVIRLERKNPFTRGLSRIWGKIWDYYEE